MGSILHKRGTGVPSAGSLTVGELAIDKSTGKVYTKTTGGQVVEVGGGGGGGSMGMKLAVQPSTAGDFRLALGDTTSTTANNPGPTWSSLWESDPPFNLNTNSGNYHTQTLTVPSGMNFLLQSISPAEVTGSYRVLMNTITIDGVAIYQNIDQNTYFHNSSWPSSVGTNIDNKRGSLSDTPIIVESSFSFDAKAVIQADCRARVHGFFIRA